MNCENLEKQNSILNRSLRKLKLSNPRVSIRSLASGLGISHTFLGRLIAGKVPIPPRKVAPLAAIFKMDESDASDLQNLSLKMKSGGLEVLSMATTQSRHDFVDLPEGTFRFFSNWWAFAVIDLLACKMPMPITRRSLQLFLKIESSELESFLNEMIRLHVISEKNQILSKEKSHIRLPTRASNSHFRQLYSQIADLTKQELKRDKRSSFEQRLISGYSCSVNPKNLRQAKRILSDAIRECAEVLSQGDCTDVYWVQTSMFSLLSQAKPVSDEPV